MFKKLMIIFLFALFLAGAVGAVSAENSTDVSIDLSDVQAEPVYVENDYDILSSSPNDYDVLGVDIDVPDVDIVGPEGKIKGPKFKMPEGELIGPEVDIKGPKVDIDVPDVDVVGPDWHIKMPKASEDDVLDISMPDIDLNLKGPKVKGDVDVSLPKSPMPTTTFYGYNDVLGESQVQEQYTQQQQQQQQQQFPHSLIIDKYWEGNDSGSITYVEIELLRQAFYQEQHQELPDSEGAPEGAEPQTIQIVGPDGVLRDYISIGKYNITKENNWRLVINNLYYREAGYDYYGNNGWYLSNFYEYIIREVNLPENVINISANYVSYNATSDAMSVYWNLTNRYIPSNDTNETEENVTEEPPINSTVENVTLKEVPVNDEIVNIAASEDTNITVETNETEEVSKDVQKASDVKNATGNPLVLLLMVISLIGVPVLRRKD